MDKHVVLPLMLIVSFITSDHDYKGVWYMQGRKRIAFIGRRGNIDWKKQRRDCH
jgi:hypothetical protein